MRSTLTTSAPLLRRLSRSLSVCVCLLFFSASFVKAQSLPRREADPVSPQVESIYEKGLRFLAQSQDENGSWSDVNGSEPGVVGLAIKAFAARGEDPNFGRYSQNIKRGIDYILDQQEPETGYIGTGMYTHGFATLALAEFYGMLDDERLGPALEKAIALILSAQKKNGKNAWRYNPDSVDADSTVTGCQLIALYAARNAGIPVPEEALTKAQKYMNQCRSSDGGYGYTSSISSKPTLTAIGLLCQALAKQNETRGFAASTNFLRSQINYRDKHYPFYFEYYMAQALFQADVELFEKWNKKNIQYLSVIQAPDGSFPGNKGTTFSTAGALLSLALNYRILPIYER